VRTALLFLLLSSVALSSDRFTLLSLPEHAQIQISNVYYSSEDWTVIVSKGIGRWDLTIHRATHPKEPIRIALAEETAKDLIADGVSLLYEFAFSRKGYEPNTDEPMNGIRLRALSGREGMEVGYARGATKDRYPKLEELLSKISKLIPDAHFQYRFK
jgi:hypothetical protein